MIRDLITIDNDPTGILRRVMPQVVNPELNAPMFAEEMRDLKDTMYASGGLGLAANQIGIEKSIFVILVGHEALPIINPVYVRRSPKKIKSYGEGCLSCGTENRVDIRRHREVVIGGYNEIGGYFEFKPRQKLVNIAAQHEMDHLRGVLIIDK